MASRGKEPGDPCDPDSSCADEISSSSFAIAVTLGAMLPAVVRRSASAATHDLPPSPPPSHASTCHKSC